MAKKNRRELSALNLQNPGRPANYFYEKHEFSNRLGEKIVGTRGNWALLEYSLVLIIDMWVTLLTL